MRQPKELEMMRTHDITVPVVRHEMIIHDCLLEMLGEALEFLGQANSTFRQIIYVVDYTEINPYWNSFKPLDKRDLEREGVECVRSYLLGLERLFLYFEDDDNEKIRYLRRGYDEQLELIDGILCDPRFNTIILPRHWDLLRDDISYFAHWIDKPLANWNFVNNETIERLKSEIKNTNISRQEIYNSNTESFGYWSTGSEKKRVVSNLIRQFIVKSNFCAVSDFPWQNYDVAQNSAEALWTQDGSLEAQKEWARWIEEGNNQYNKAYGTSGYRHREDQGARDLATVSGLDLAVQEATNKRLRVAFVTRNRQYHNALAVARGHSSKNLPWVFHPRMLSAFMIDQSTSQRTVPSHDGPGQFAEIKHIFQYREESLQLARSIVNDSHARNIKIVNPAFKNFLKTSIRRSWDGYRRSDLAQQIRIRIGIRKDQEDSWAKRQPHNPIAKFLNNILKIQLTRLDVYRELALMNSVPRQEIWPEGDKFVGIRLPIKLEGDVVSCLVLFKTSAFAHAFMFRSQTLAEEIEVHKNSSNIYISIENIFDNVLSKYHSVIDSVNSEDVEDIEEFRRKSRIDRFELVLLSAICLVARGSHAMARQYIFAARSIWPESTAHRSDFAEKLLRELDYLDAIVNRLDWRKSTEGDISAKSRAIYDSGVKQLKTIINKKASSENKRMQLLIVGFARELYSFSSFHKISKKRNALSVDECLKRLRQVYQLSVEREFHITAARSMQQMIAFVRMADANALPLNKSLRKQLSEASIAADANRKMVDALDKLRKLPGWNDSDLPATMKITEAVGKWVYRDPNKVDRRKLIGARNTITILAGDIREPFFKTYIAKRVKEIDNYLQGAKKNDP